MPLNEHLKKLHPEEDPFVVYPYQKRCLMDLWGAIEELYRLAEGTGENPLENTLKTISGKFGDIMGTIDERVSRDQIEGGEPPQKPTPPEDQKPHLVLDEKAEVPQSEIANRFYNFVHADVAHAEMRLYALLELMEDTGEDKFSAPTILLKQIVEELERDKVAAGMYLHEEGGAA